MGSINRRMGIKLKDRIYNIYESISIYIADIRYFSHDDSDIPERNLSINYSHDPEASNVRKLIYILRADEKFRNKLSIKGENHRRLDKIIENEIKDIEKSLLED